MKERQQSGRNEIIAEWGRIDSIERWFGLKKGFLYKLINQGEIESVSIQNPGSSRSTRLVKVASVRAFIERHRQSPSARQS